MTIATKNDTVRARVQHDVKENAERVFAALGMSTSDAIRIFLTQVALRREFPVELKLPNQATLEAMSDAPTEQSYESADELFGEVLNGAKNKD